jgi:hypothetical protein
LPAKARTRWPSRLRARRDYSFRRSPPALTLRHSAHGAQRKDQPLFRPCGPAWSRSSPWRFGLPSGAGYRARGNPAGLPRGRHGRGNRVARAFCTMPTYSIVRPRAAGGSSPQTCARTSADVELTGLGPLGQVSFACPQLSIFSRSPSVAGLGWRPAAARRQRIAGPQAPAAGDSARRSSHT